ncbi:hypothetical protein [Lactiplantibacillus pentosus]|uniref:Uncharacterized protein n=1 Tax=Lactiplantibacillus pentosus TaxID=1589 RepID=A0AAP5UN20_LACPE|nr:hypothetical protein [Lactiplantibacillus pentosus]AUI78041.1 hypothetical protein BB562_04675 [Lactiplantibacillus pentosus]MBU7459942.1 hypothetical protein [Lactiplantibacillus pentosus]MBU7465276.1 hypothetical protein [Lactiplantibacillus pentosus]MBU7475987.1 hypothetical protein [Lactiplantibacillus pentosus]MBU7485835.1 hypothetical protein [Lactiplantibacillus pentosus]
MRFYLFSEGEQQALIAANNEWLARKQAVQECGLSATTPAVEVEEAEAFDRFKPIFFDVLGDESTSAAQMARAVFSTPGVILTNIPNV